MSSGRPRQFDTDHALDQALDVFRRKGFEGASLPDLTDAMGINRPSMYAAFGNKEELFRKALDRYTEKNHENLKQLLDTPHVRDAMRNVLYAVADGSACPKSPKGCLLVQGALACGDEAQPIREELAARRGETERIFRQRFEKAIADGDMPATSSAADCARYISTVMQGMAVQATAGVRAADLRAVADIALKSIP